MRLLRGRDIRFEEFYQTERSQAAFVYYFVNFPHPLNRILKQIH
jgi:hypothetical protein